MAEISAVYMITNTITGDFYIGSSKDVKRRWVQHKSSSIWKRYPKNPLYQDMKRYGLDYFIFEILAEVEVDKLKEKEQQFIETLKPAYNNNNAKGLNIERHKENNREYEKTDKCKKYRNEYRKTHRDEINEYQKEYMKEYEKTDKRKESHRKASNKYQNQLCYYNDQTISLNALSLRFRRQGIPHPTLEAKKYLIL